ncbi:unnamed protein product [Acanthoscelides obtectus]|uniref:Kinetochore protein SPC25 n=1 Tax=Acanthoscelides obtectus TaxID=200917 RepID=A0A9P0LRC3_ACAOB|nr:unnamed protein product [Acanthoscelides obtectus]CAK1675079.1 hypothetical protein AOBTE_LOCUS29886 [Acanthoscelides obtectus]
MDLDDTVFLEEWSQQTKETDVQYHKLVSTLKPVIPFEEVFSNDDVDIKVDADACVQAVQKSKELAAKKQKLQQELLKLTKEVENLKDKNQQLEETIETYKVKCHQASSKNKTDKDVLNTAINKYEKNLDMTVSIENISASTYEATFKFKKLKKKVLKVLIDREKGEIIDHTVLRDLPGNEGDDTYIPNILYLLRKSIL